MSQQDKKKKKKSNFEKQIMAIITQSMKKAVDEAIKELFKDFK